MISDHLPNVKGLILDMDGVLWRDTEPIGDLPAIFQAFSDQDIKVILATNNGTKTVDEFFSKIRRFGVDLEDWQVISAAQATGIFLAEKYPNGCTVYAVGTPSLGENPGGCRLDGCFQNAASTYKLLSQRWIPA